MKLAPFILYGGVAVVLIMDLSLYFYGGWDTTISGWVSATISRTAIVAFLLGVLFGHLFLGHKEKEPV